MEVILHRMPRLEEGEHSRRGFLDLPNELFFDISTYMTKAELKGLRLVCSRLRQVTTPLVFTTAVVAARRRVFDTFVALSNHPDLSRHVVEIIYDGSWFDSEIAEQYRSTQGPPQAICKLTSLEGRAKYVKAFEEQENIIAHELAPTVRRAIKNFPQLRRLIYADFARFSGFQWDRIEDLGPAFRMGDPQWTVEKAEITFDSPLFLSLCSDLSLRRKYFGLALLLGALSQPDCKAKIIDLRIGDSTYSRGAGGIPDTLFMALSDNSYGPLSAFESLQRLDITISDRTSTGHPKQKFPQLPHLELLRLVGPMCSPTEILYAPPLRKPAIRFPKYCGEAYWPRLRALELKWIAFKTDDFLHFLDHHRDTLRFINLYEIYIRERSTWGLIVRTLHSMYPDLIVEPYQRLHHFPSFETLLLDFTLYDGQAILINTGIPLGLNQSLDDYDEDQVSNYSADEDSESEASESSDGFDSSVDDDYDGAEEYQGLTTPL